MELVLVVMGLLVDCSAQWGASSRAGASRFNQEFKLIIPHYLIF